MKETNKGSCCRWAWQKALIMVSPDLPSLFKDMWITHLWEGVCVCKDHVGKAHLRSVVLEEISHYSH